MSNRIDEWMQTENAVVKSYEQLLEELPKPNTTAGYHEKVGKPWTEQNRMEDEIRRALGVPPAWATDKEKIEFHRRQLVLLEKAKLAPRCEHVFSDGRRCRSPRMRKERLCYAHVEMQARRPQRMNLPPLEDANAVAMWLMEVARGLLDGQISERTAGLLFYGLQLAMVNARWTTFTETDPAEMVRKAENRRDRSESPTSDSEPGAGLPAAPRHLTAKDAKNAKDVTAESAEFAENERRTKAQPPCRSNGEAIIKGLQPGAAVPHEHGVPGDTSYKSLVFGEQADGG
ncbi:MAG TPA: hypothetical protein VKH81_24170 [Candidatus Angelobacter sp.]|nr:hypothetical protein [Candidatus Angelobacter sp.]